MTQLGCVVVVGFVALLGGCRGSGSSPASPPASRVEILASAPCEVEATRCRKIRYRSEQLSVVGFVIEPTPAARAALGAAGTAPLPAVLVARGGNRELGTIRGGFLEELAELADRGFIVVATQYRGADGGDGQDEFGGADLADLMNLAPLAREIPGVDAANLFVLGYSRGGMQAAMALRAGLPVRAAALFSGLFDLEQVAAARPEMARNFGEMIPLFATQRDAELRRRSAVHWASELRVPVLLLAGTRDERVAYAANSERLAAQLAAAGRPHKLVSYDDGHGLSAHRAETTQEIAAWFRGHLAPAR